MTATGLRTLLIVLMIATACSADGNLDGESAPVFGATPGPCGVTVLTNDVDDQAKLRSAVECALGEVDAKRAFTWDLLVPTVEGDPILYRYASDGERVTIITDTTRDAFGSPTVLVQVCETIDETGLVPLGVGCIDSTGVSFELSTDVWPP